MLHVFTLATSTGTATATPHDVAGYRSISGVIAADPKMEKREMENESTRNHPRFFPSHRLSLSSPFPPKFSTSLIHRNNPHHTSAAFCILSQSLLFTWELDRQKTVVSFGSLTNWHHLISTPPPPSIMPSLMRLSYRSS